MFEIGIYEINYNEINNTESDIIEITKISPCYITFAVIDWKKLGYDYPKKQYKKKLKEINGKKVIPFERLKQVWENVPTMENHINPIYKKFYHIDEDDLKHTNLQKYFDSMKPLRKKRMKQDLVNMIYDIDSKYVYRDKCYIDYTPFLVEYDDMKEALEALGGGSEEKKDLLERLEFFKKILGNK